MEHTLDQFGKEKITPHPTRTAAIVLAAGQGKRMKSKIQKQFLLLEEKPVIWYALHAFEESRVDDVILVTGLRGFKGARQPAFLWGGGLRPDS